MAPFLGVGLLPGQAAVGAGAGAGVHALLPMEVAFQAQYGADRSLLHMPDVRARQSGGTDTAVVVVVGVPRSGKSHTIAHLLQVSSRTKTLPLDSQAATTTCSGRGRGSGAATLEMATRSHVWMQWKTLSPAGPQPLKSDSRRPPTADFVLPSPVQSSWISTSPILTGLAFCAGSMCAFDAALHRATKAWGAGLKRLCLDGRCFGRSLSPKRVLMSPPADRTRVWRRQQLP